MNGLCQLPQHSEVDMDISPSLTDRGGEAEPLIHWPKATKLVGGRVRSD